MVRRGLTLALLAGGLAWAEPTGPQVIHGGVNIQTTGPTTQINQTTDRAIINWNGFNIDVHELVRFVQPNQLSVILNRVVGTDPSNILGQLQANGRVFLINPNGIVFGPNARVDVGGLMATTLNLSDQDFLAGRYHLSQDPNKGLAAVVNQGELRVADGGFLLLVAPTVDNQGVIVAKAGQVGLVGSSDATINFDGQGLVEIRLPQAQIANPGTVALAPAAVSEVLRQVVADPGIVEAEGLVVQQGSLEAGRVLLNSTRATLVAPGSHTTGSEVRILSNGLSRLDGNVQADFVELSGRQFGLTGSVTAAQFVLDPDTIHITDSNAPAPLDDYLPNVLLADDAGVNELSRGALEALPSGTRLALEAQHLIQVDNMASDEINLAPSVSLHMTVFDGDIRFQDTRDRLTTSAGGSFQFDAPAGSVVLGDLRSGGGPITIHAGVDATFESLTTFDVLGSLPPGAVDIGAGRDLLLGGIGAGNSRLEAGRDILNAVPDGGSVQGTQASFVAGGRVGTASDPVFVGLEAISGLASEFNFRYEEPPPEGLVNGINGLNIRTNPPSPAPAPLPVLAAQGVERIDQVPVFQVNEITASGYQPPKQVESPAGADEALAFVQNLPGVHITSQRRVVDVLSMHIQSDDIMPLYQGLVERGWVVHMTGERLRAEKGDQVISGSLSPQGADLQLRDRQNFDFEPLLAQLRDGKPVQIEVDPYGLAALLELLSEQGWRARLTGDRLQGQRGGQKLEGVVEGSRARLQVSADSFAFLKVAGLQKNVQVCDSQKFVYQLGPEGLMPWIEAFAAHGFRVRATDEHLEAWKAGERAEGTVSGQRFFLKVGPHSCFAASDDDADLQELLSWLLRSRQFPLVSRTRMVDTTRVKLQGSLTQLVTRLKSHGWTFSPGNRTAVRGHYRLQLKPLGRSLRLTLSRTP